MVLTFKNVFNKKTLWREAHAAQVVPSFRPHLTPHWTLTLTPPPPPPTPPYDP